MYLQAVCIDRPGMTAHGGKIKSGFSFFDEVLHFAAATVKRNNLMRFGLHRCNYECIQMDYLVIGFLDFEDNPSWMRPAYGLILEFSVFHRVINLISACGAVKGIVCFSHIFHHLHTNHVSSNVSLLHSKLYVHNLSNSNFPPPHCTTHCSYILLIFSADFIKGRLPYYR